MYATAKRSSNGAVIYRHFCTANILTSDAIRDPSMMAIFANIAPANSIGQTYNVIRNLSDAAYDEKKSPRILRGESYELGCLNDPSPSSLHMCVSGYIL